MKNSIIALLPSVALAAVICFFSGCSTVDSGSDPVIVRTEQVEATAENTFDTVLKIDSSNRSYFATNAPAFHLFCEALRTPVVYGTNTVPKCNAAILSLDDIKLAYKSGMASSNDVVTAIGIVETLMSQAAYWQENYDK